MAKTMVSFMGLSVVAVMVFVAITGSALLRIGEQYDLAPADRSATDPRDNVPVADKRQMYELLAMWGAQDVLDVRGVGKVKLTDHAFIKHGNDAERALAAIASSSPDGGGKWDCPEAGKIYKLAFLDKGGEVAVAVISRRTGMLITAFIAHNRGQVFDRMEQDGCKRDGLRYVHP